MLVCVLTPWGLVGYSRFELSYAKATRKHLRQLDFVIILDHDYKIIYNPFCLVRV